MACYLGDSQCAMQGQRMKANAGKLLVAYKKNVQPLTPCMIRSSRVGLGNGKFCLKRFYHMPSEFFEENQKRSQCRRCSLHPHELKTADFLNHVVIDASLTQYYSVPFAAQPGLYTDWSEAKKQIDTFPGSFFKKFSIRADAEKHYCIWRPLKFQLRGEYPLEGSTNRYYAVTRGKDVGVFVEYATVRESIARYPQPMHKNFSTLQEAVSYYEEFALGITVSASDYAAPHIGKPKTFSAPQKKTK